MDLIVKKKIFDLITDTTFIASITALYVAIRDVVIVIMRKRGEK